MLIEPPVHVDPGMVVIPIFHDRCKQENRKIIFADMLAFIHRQEIAIGVVQNLKANERLTRDPEAEI